jgi:Ni/Co efflux regulator RcnB
MELIMKSRSLAPTLMAMAMALTPAAPAFAQGDGDLAAQEEATRQLKRDKRRLAREQGYYWRYEQSDPRYREGRAFGSDRRYYRGDRLPPQYRHRHYVVEDWRGHQLSAPPRGYHWVQVGGDYALVANNSGVIRQFFPLN